MPLLVDCRHCCSSTTAIVGWLLAQNRRHCCWSITTIGNQVPPPLLVDCWPSTAAIATQVPPPFLLKYRRRCCWSTAAIVGWLSTQYHCHCCSSTNASASQVQRHCWLIVGPVPPPLYPFTRRHCCPSTSWLLAQYRRHYTLLHTAVAAQVPVDCRPSTAVIIPFYTLPLLLKYQLIVGPVRRSGWKSVVLNIRILHRLIFSQP